MKSYRINTQSNFIAGWYIPKNICTKILQYYKASDNKFEGNVGHISQKTSVVNKDVKDSVDVVLEDKDIQKEYYIQIQKCLNNYKKLYNWCNFSSLGILEPVTIQKYYPPNGGFHEWHYEKTSLNFPIGQRHLVFMTYLNDVKCGGETEFYYQRIKIAPEKGLTLIWPSEWMFVHRGNRTKNEEKCIVTGWISHII